MGLFGGGGKGVLVETAKAEIRDITQVVTASGKVQPEIEVKISPDVSGEIIYLGIVEGQQVEKGLLLIRIRPDFYQAQYEKATAGVSQARAGLSRAKADLLSAELDMERTRELHERNVVAQAEFELSKTKLDIASANLDAARYQVAAAEAEQSQAGESLARTRIFSPMTGTISLLNVELGERVVGTVQMAGTELLRIARLDQMEIETEVNENDVVNIALGDTARIEVDAYPGQTFKGVVTEIAKFSANRRPGNPGTGDKFSGQDQNPGRSQRRQSTETIDGASLRCNLRGGGTSTRRYAAIQARYVEHRRCVYRF